MADETTNGNTKEDNEQNDGIPKELEKDLDDKPPAIAISVIGDSVSYVPNSWPRHLFKKALINAIETFGDAWILCHCHATSIDTCSVTKTLLETLEEYHQISWEELMKRPKVSFYGIQDSIGSKEALEQIDDSEKDQYFTKTWISNEEKSFFEGRLSEQFVRVFVETSDAIKTNTYEIVLPVLLVVVEGGMETIKYVAKALKKKVPVLLVKGSGKAADLIDSYLAEEEERNFIFKQKVALHFGVRYKTDGQKHYESGLKEIKDNRELVMSYNVYEDTPETFSAKAKDVIWTSWTLRHGLKAKLSEALDSDYKKNQDSLMQHKTSPLAFYLFAKALKRERKTEIIGTALEKKRKDEMNDEVMQMASVKIFGIKDETMKTDLMMDALMAGKHDVVEVLLDMKDVPFTDIDSKINLLYTKIDDELEMILKLRDRMWKSIKAQSKKPKENGKNQQNKTKENKPCTNNDRSLWIPEERLQDIIHYNDSEQIRRNVHPNLEDKLFLWAVQTNQRDMAELFWKKTEHPILSALVASELLRKMSELALGYNKINLQHQLQEHSKIFCQRAIYVAEAVCKERSSAAIKLLTTKEYLWGMYLSPNEFAVTFKKYHFVASEASLQSTNATWYGDNTRTTLKQVWMQRNMGKKTTWIKNLAQAPVTIYFLHHLFFTLYLLFLSAFVLSYLEEVNLSSERLLYEFMSYLWPIGTFVEEYLPAFRAIKKSKFCQAPRLCFFAWLREIRLYFSDFWNILDVLGFVFIIAAVAFRFLGGQEFEDDTRMLFSITQYLMYLRFLNVLLVFESTGITIIMLKEAVKELIRFMVVFGVIIISTGIFYHANLYPNHYDLFSRFGIQYWSFWRIISLPFWAIFGEFKEEIGGEGEPNCSFNETIYVNDIGVERCPQKNFAVVVMSGLFTVIASLLLVNLIIAMLTFRFEEIRGNSEKYWRFHRSKVVMEFENRQASPINLVWRIYRFVFPSGSTKATDDILEIVKKHWKNEDKVILKRTKEEIRRIPTTDDKQLKENVDMKKYKKDQKKKRRKYLEKIENNIKGTINKWNKGVTCEAGMFTLPEQPISPPTGLEVHVLSLICKNTVALCKVYNNVLEIINKTENRLKPAKKYQLSYTTTMAVSLVLVLLKQMAASVVLIQMKARIAMVPRTSVSVHPQMEEVVKMKMNVFTAVGKLTKAVPVVQKKVTGAFALQNHHQYNIYATVTPDNCNCSPSELTGIGQNAEKLREGHSKMKFKYIITVIQHFSKKKDDKRVELLEKRKNKLDKGGADNSGRLREVHLLLDMCRMEPKDPERSFEQLEKQCRKKWNEDTEFLAMARTVANRWEA